MAADICIICDKYINVTEEVNDVKDKGKQTLIAYSEKRKDNKSVAFQNAKKLIVHSKCRKSYCNDRCVKADEKRQSLQDITNISTSRDIFVFKDKCLFCTEDASDTFVQNEIKKSHSKRSLVSRVTKNSVTNTVSSAIAASGDELWHEENKEVSSSGSERSSSMGIRAPSAIPGLVPAPYLHTNNSYPNRLSNKCEVPGAMKHLEVASPSGSEESNSPTELNCYRRLTDKPPLMKRLAMGLSGALMPQPADDSTPLVDSPASPTNRPVTLNGGYVNEAISETDIKSIKDRDANNMTVTKERDNCKPSTRDRDVNNMCAMKDRDSNNKFSPTDNTSHSPGVPVKHIHIDSVNINQSPHIDKTLPSNFDSDFIKKHNNIKNSIHSLPQRTSRAASSSSGGSSCGGCSNNNIPSNAPAREESELRLAPWFQAGIPREIALEVLSNQPVGAFMVRSSTTKLGCYALSLRVPRDFQPGGIAHYLILRTAKGYKIKGFTKEFTSLTSLITHHSVMPELLPCPLWLSRYNPGYARSERAADAARDFEDIDSDPDYNTLADFRKMMADLNV